MSGDRVARLVGGKEPRPRAAVSAKRQEGYDARRRETLASARAGALSLKRRKLKVTAYSIEKETKRLSELPGSKVRKVSANTVRDNDLCRKLLGPDNAAVLERDPAKFPRWLRLLSREELMELVMADRAWAADCSARLVEAEVELGRCRLKARGRADD